jgi:hypothetical protein
MPAEFSLEAGVVSTFYVPSNTPVTVLPQGTPISGVDGEDGEDGNSVRSGNGAPSALVGNDGDFYIDKTAWRIYGPKAAGAWPGSSQSLIGPTGPSGAGIGRVFLYMGG